jgi:chloramphenicol 3-O phosphotransferase
LTAGAHSPSAPGRALLLIGPSSSGKSTLAAELQKQLWPSLWLHYAVDDFWTGFLAGHRPTPDGFARFYPAVYRAVAAFAHTGLDVILEAVISHAHLVPHVRTAFAGIDTTVVGLTCPLEELERREAIRPDRRTGLARNQHERLHTLWTYDLAVDTAKHTPAESAALVTAHLRRRPVATALRRTADRAT